MDLDPAANIVVLCTCASAPEAQSLARALVTEQLAACVNVLPGATSIYRWQGAVEESAEVLLAIKSSAGLFEELRERIAALHSYAVPEIVALPIAAGAPSYLQWLAGELRAPRSI
ncbi:MAG: divalent-cation tolerance protein CutA [Acidobacteria bacterium]|nr:divalent-cation tolerance protein CutA [Acidobacteriota bacterium]